MMRCHSSKGHSDELVCARCRLISVAVTHLSSSHVLLAKVSSDLLKTTIHCFGSFAPPLEALQQNAARWTELQALQDSMPLSVHRSIRSSLAESSIMKALLVVHATLSAIRDVPTVMSCLAILEALQLSQLVLNSDTCSPTSPRHSSMDVRSSFASLCASMSCWTFLILPDQHFHPSQALRRTAVTLMKAVASNPIVWSGGEASDDHPRIQALECGGHVQLPEAQEQKFRDSTCDSARKYMGRPSNSLRMLSGRATRNIASTACAAPDASITAISSFMLQFIYSGAEEPKVRACAMQCAAEALVAGGMDDCVGAEMIRAGVAAVEATLHDMLVKSELQGAAGAVSVSGGHGLAAAVAFVSAAAGWIHARRRNCLTQPSLRDAIDLIQNSVIWPALEGLACSQQPQASVDPVLAATGKISLRSGAISASVAIVKSISQFPGWCVGVSDRCRVQEAGRQCVRNVQAVLEALPSGHVITALCVQAVVCLLNFSDAIDKHDMREGLQAASDVLVVSETPDERPRVWEWLAMSCLNKLLTPMFVAKSLHVLSPILRTILEVSQRQLCSTTVHELLTDRMAVLNTLDAAFSRKLFSGQALNCPCSGKAMHEPMDEVNSTTSVEGEVASHVWAANHSCGKSDCLSGCHCQSNFETCVQTRACSQTEAMLPMASLLDAIDGTGLSGTIMMHVKEMLALHQEGHHVNNIPGCK